jgi:hypothetical protein
MPNDRSEQFMVDHMFQQFPLPRVPLHTHDTSRAFSIPRSGSCGQWRQWSLNHKWGQYDYSTRAVKRIFSDSEEKATFSVRATKQEAKKGERSEFAQ